MRLLTVTIAQMLFLNLIVLIHSTLRSVVKIQLGLHKHRLLHLQVNDPIGKDVNISV